MAAKLNRYTLDVFNNLLFNGFNYELPAETISIISELSLEVGSPDYVKTPIFKKRENPMKSSMNNDDGDINWGGGGGSNGGGGGSNGGGGGSNGGGSNGGGGGSNGGGGGSNGGGSKKRRGGNKNAEISEGEWETMRNFQTTKIGDREGIDCEIDNIRSYLNKITDKNFSDFCPKIMELIDGVISKTSEDIKQVSLEIFDIASTNRFYSKIYADLYTIIIKQYDVMKGTFEESLSNFSELFNIIEYVDPKVDYDKFCKINKDNEKRKALGAFFINLSINGVIPLVTIQNITRTLLYQIYKYISEENKKNEVDELTENVALFYKKDFYDNDTVKYELIEGYTITEIIERIAISKVKDYKSLTNKTIFKFMDMIDM
jgi:hypothetical protein